MSSISLTISSYWSSKKKTVNWLRKMKLNLLKKSKMSSPFLMMKIKIQLDLANILDQLTKAILPQNLKATLTLKECLLLAVVSTTTPQRCYIHNHPARYLNLLKNHLPKARRERNLNYLI